MKKLLRAAALALSLAFAPCTLQACATGGVVTTAAQTEMAGYDVLQTAADTADKLCTGTAPALSHDKCVTVRNDLRTAKTMLDKGQGITGLIGTIEGELH